MTGRFPVGGPQHAAAPSFDEMFVPSRQSVSPGEMPTVTPRPMMRPMLPGATPGPSALNGGNAVLNPTQLAAPPLGVQPINYAVPAGVRREGHLPMVAAPSGVRGQSPDRGLLSRFRRQPKTQTVATSSNPATHAAYVAQSNAGGQIRQMSGEVCETSAPQSWQQMLTDFDPTVEHPSVIKIPVRLSPGERPCFSEQDITLQDGDIVFVESKRTEVFFTGGLLGGGQYELPRDYDLRLIEALSIAQGPQNVQQGRSAGGNSALNGDVTESGSRVIIMRTMPAGNTMRIEVDLYKAITHPAQSNIVIQAGDVIIVQYTAAESVYAFFQRNFIESALFGFATGFVAADSN